MPTKSARIRRIQNVAIALLVLAGLVNSLDRSTLAIANHAISVEMGLDAAQMGLLLSAFSISYAFSQLPIGILLDRYGSRLVLGLGMFVWSVAQFAGALVHTLQQFFVSRLVLGIGESPQFPASAKVINEWYTVKERGRPTGVVVSSTTIAPALAPPLLTALMLVFGWRGMFAIAGGLGIAVAIGWYILYRDRRNVDVSPAEVDYLDEGQKVSVKKEQVSFSDWRGLLTSRATWGMMLGYMGIIYMIWLYLTWLPGYLEHERHLTIARTGWVLSIPYIAGTLGMLSSGVVSDWLLARGLSLVASRKWPICTGMILAALFTVPAAYTTSTPMAVLYIALALYWVNLACGSAWALVTVASPRRLVASLGSMQNFGGYLGGSFAPIVTGVVVDATQSFVDALLISAVVSLVGALAYFLLVRDVIQDPVTPCVGS